MTRILWNEELCRWTEADGECSFKPHTCHCVSEIKPTLSASSMSDEDTFAVYLLMLPLSTTPSVPSVSAQLWN